MLGRGWLDCLELELGPELLPVAILPFGWDGTVSSLSFSSNRSGLDLVTLLNSSLPLSLLLVVGGDADAEGDGSIL
jgi:hypothetical protein